MNLLSLVCVFLMMVCSILAFRSDPDAPRTPHEAAAAAAPPAERTLETREPVIDLRATELRIRDEVVTPMRRSRSLIESMSRVARPPRMVHYRLESPPDDRRPLVRFRLYESVERESDVALAAMPARWIEERRVRPIAVGRIDVPSGRIEIAPGAEPDPATGAWLPLAEALARLGARSR